MRAIDDARRRASAHLQAVLRAPRRDHAGQLAELRRAVENTTALPPCLGLLLWPGPFGVEAVEVELGVRRNRFRVVLDEVRPTWRALFGASPSIVVFDPWSLSPVGDEFGSVVRSRRFERILLGKEACRRYIAELVAGAGA